MATELQKGTSKLRPRARLIKTIGEELISNDVVAIIELVKNSYDADASIVVLSFEGKTKEVPIDKKKVKLVLEKLNSKITIEDDGTGMSLQTIQSSWMEPATITKTGQKLSPGKRRRYTGEKGIGRFASAKLSNKLQIVSKCKDDNEVVVNFQWADFSDNEKYLDQVETAWEVRTPIKITNKGTCLYLSELNSEWDEEKFNNLKVALSRLINPVAPVPDFLIELNFPAGLGNLSGLVSAPAAINKPDYYIKGKVDKDGKANIVYYSKKKGTGPSYEKDLSKLLNPKRIPSSGPFSFELRVWDREKESLDELAKEVGSTTKNIRSDLDELSGISVYRDNFRVLPYGEPKNDWLRLNMRRVNNPTMRVSNNQIVGYISIGLDDNQGLKDQSNREGIVESDAFNDLQAQVIELLNELETKRYEERPRREDETKPNSLYENFSIAKLADVITQKLANDKEAQDVLKDTQSKIETGLKTIQDVLSRYRRLSTLGLLIDSVLHDGSQFLLRIDSEARLLKKAANQKIIIKEDIIKHADNIEDQRKVLSQLFKRIEPFGGRKRGRPAKIILEDSIRNVFEISRHDLDRLNITTTLPTSQNTVTIDDAELQTVLVNLLQNAMHWLQENTSDRNIEVQVERATDELAIIFSDSGPGIPEEHVQLIFDPYFTTRSDGVGLGLTIVGEIVSDYGGEFYLVNNGPLSGATFKIVFRRRI